MSLKTAMGLARGGSLTWMPTLQSTGPSVHHKVT